jgi:secondary thiamine-phosphate synthase enzyme
MKFRINISSQKRIEAINVTGKVEEVLKKSQIKNGIILIYVPHTTTAITINEAYDSNVMEDFLNQLSKVIPYDGSYRHSEGNADAHIKSSLIGNQRFIFIEDGKLLLGRWEGIFFLEFDGPRERNLILELHQ